MKSTVRAVIRAGAVLSSALALTLSGGSPAVAGSAAGAAPTRSWELVDYGQRICVDEPFGLGTYFLVYMTGVWQTPVEVGLDDLPPGSTSTTTTVAPGSGKRGRPVSGLLVTIPPSPAGVYNAAMRASDGTAEDSVPIIIDVRPDC